MLEIILPSPLVGLLAPFEPCFHAPSYWTFGLVLALWVRLPMGGSRGFALPVLCRLYVGAKRGGSKDAPGRPRRGTRQQVAVRAHGAHPRPTRLALARELLVLVAGSALAHSR